MANSQPKPKPPADEGLVVHVHTETSDDVAEYWTPERMNEAKPVPMPHVVAPPVVSVPQLPKKGKKS